MDHRLDGYAVHKTRPYRGLLRFFFWVVGKSPTDRRRELTGRRADGDAVDFEQTLGAGQNGGAGAAREVDRLPQRRVDSACRSMKTRSEERGWKRRRGGGVLHR